MVAAVNRNVRSRDDELFTKVLSSAHSLQQQHDRIQSRLPAARFSEILAEIINTQSLIRSRELDFETAIHLIASRAEKLSGAAGAAIALVQGEMLEYRIGTGIGAILGGFKCRAHEIVSFERLKSDSLAETDTWQEKVLGGRVVANVMSAPIYRGDILAGCLQLFSRHGHFDLDGRYVCELMSGIVSHVIETVPIPQAPPREERPGTVPVERAPLPADENRSDPAQAAGTRAKLEWPGANTRELEARLKKAAMSANAADQAPKAVAAGESPKFLQPSPRTTRQEPDVVRQQEKPVIRDKKEEGKDRNPQIVSRGGHGPTLSHGSLALVPSETHAPRLVSSPPAVTDKPVTDKSWDEDDRGEPLRDAPAAVVAHEQPGADSPSDTAKGKAKSASSDRWKQMTRLIYPLFVLLFAIGVRIRAGAHNWPLEIIIYILLVLTTLELQSRWPKS